MTNSNLKSVNQARGEMCFCASDNHVLGVHGSLLDPFNQGSATTIITIVFYDDQPKYYEYYTPLLLTMIAIFDIMKIVTFHFVTTEVKQVGDLPKSLVQLFGQHAR